MPTTVKCVHSSLHRLHRLRRDTISCYATQSVFHPPIRGDPPPDSMVPWRDSASLILVAPSTKDDLNPLPNILITKRSKGSAFAPNTLCFPGGQVDTADCHPKWVNHFSYFAGTDIRHNVKFLGDQANVPPIYGHRNKAVDRQRGPLDALKVIPTPISLRLTAIRETFEECGILLCRQADVKAFGRVLGKDNPEGIGNTTHHILIEDPDELEEWQMKVKKDPMQFMALCQEKSCFPDINALVEWSNWLTPNSFGVRRFDTLFYMAIAPVTLPFLIDPYEVATARWTTAQGVLKGAGDGKAKVIPPQIYELTRLRNTKLDRLKKLMKMRLHQGIERCCPCYIKVKDGVLSVFPGDDLYPLDYNIVEFEEIREIDKTLEDARASTSSHHRIEFKSEFDFQLVVNIGPKAGQVYVD